MATETRPAFPAYARDWYIGTRSLSAAARGVHMDLMTVSWINGGVPEAPDELRRIAGLDKPEWRRVWAELEAKWPVDTDGLRRNRKLEAVRAESAQFTADVRELGKAGGKASAKARAKKYGSAAPRRTNGDERPPDPGGPRGEPVHEPLHEPASRTTREAASHEHTKPATATATATALPSGDQTDDDRDVGGSGAHLRLVESSSVTDHGSGRHGLAVREFVDLWNRIRTEPKIATLTPSERRVIVAALQVHSLDHLEVCLRLSEESDYLAGRKDRTGISVEKFFHKLDGIARGEYKNHQAQRQTRVAGLSGGGIPVPIRPRWHCHHTDELCGQNTHCYLRTLREVRAGQARLEDVPEPLHSEVRDALAQDEGRTA